MEIKKPHKPKYSSCSQSPIPSPRNSSRQIFSIYKKQSLLQSSTKVDSNFQSSFIEGASLTLKYPRFKGFDITTQVTKLNDKYFSSIQLQTKNKKCLTVIQDFIENLITPSTIALTQALTIANSTQNMSAYYFFEQTFKDHNNLEDQLLQSIRKHSEFQSSKIRNLMFFHGKQYQILAKNSLQLRELEWKINHKSKSNFSIYYRPDKSNRLAQLQNHEQNGRQLQLYFTKAVNNCHQVTSNKVKSLTQHQRKSNYQKILPEAQLQSYTMISQYGLDNTQSEKFIRLVHQMERKINENTIKMQKKKSSIKTLNKKHKKANSVDKELGRRSKNASKKVSQINFKKDKVPFQNNHQIDCFQPQSVINTKFHQISSILKFKPTPQSHIIENQKSQDFSSLPFGSQIKNTNSNTNKLVDLRIDNEYFYQKSYGSTCVKTCSATPNYHSRMPSQFFQKNQFSQYLQSLKCLQNQQNNIMTLKSNLKPWPKNDKLSTKKEKKSKTASNSLIKMNSVIHSGTSTPKMLKLYPINQKTKSKKSLDIKSSIQSQNKIYKSHQKLMNLQTKRLKVEKNETKRNKIKGSNKQNMNKKDEFNEYGINFGSCKNKKSIVSSLIPMAENKIQGEDQRIQMNQGLIKRKQIDGLRNRGEKTKIKGLNSQRIKGKTKDKIFGEDLEVNRVKQVKISVQD